MWSAEERSKTTNKPHFLDIDNWIFKDKTKGIVMKVRCVFLSLMLSLGLSFSASALERFAGVEDGSDENLKAVCQDYMVNSFLKNDPELFFHLLPKSMKKLETILENDWPQGHLKRFGSDPLTEYEVFEMEEQLIEKTYKGQEIKRIKIKYKAGIMDRVRGSSCSFKLYDDNRWYFQKKP
ncbi:hypothetical protein L2735_04470 [Shewanella olleyana]|uniref:hypothetical protein n=1 Tax=Shewanella olleyana TaxID=135626 RepID=UPI00200EB0DB|nr:hypothetical protein [Shewanella olleyana]MCL1066061.1 hypothetical protein [Shewanella olleyana]